MDRNASKISIVIPALDEQDLIAQTLDEVTRVAAEVAEDHEIIVVDDGSEDSTFEKVQQARALNARIKGLKLSRHFGKEAAMLAGLARADGQAVITMDGDLQHPPELIPAMLDKWKQGAQIVHGVKRSRKYGGRLNRTAARLFNSVFSRIAGFSIVDSSDFKLLDAGVARLLVKGFPEQQRFHRGLSQWVGFRQESVEFVVPERPFGQSRWSITGLFRYGWNTLTSFTSLPLHLVPLLGIVMLVTAVLLGADAFVSRLSGHAVSGFATLEVTILFSGSLIMIGLGVVGQYLARIYDEVKHRPVYLVADECGFEPPAGGIPQAKDTAP